MSNRFFTIGHSTRSIEAFIELLRPLDIRLIIDVRKFPRSRANPQYNASDLSEALSNHQIQYEHIAELGGLRGKAKSRPVGAGAFWRNRSFQNYADYANSDKFRSGLARLRELGHATTCAILCAEALWWRCHRRIIADYLIACGEPVFHIMAANHVEAARLTEGARLGSNCEVIYSTHDLPISEDHAGTS